MWDDFEEYVMRSSLEGEPGLMVLWWNREAWGNYAATIEIETKMREMVKL